MYPRERDRRPASRGLLLWTLARGGLARLLFFVSRHVPPLLRSFEKLFLEIGIACLLGKSFALARLGAIYFY